MTESGEIIKESCWTGKEEMNTPHFKKRLGVGSFPFVTLQRGQASSADMKREKNRKGLQAQRETKREGQREVVQRWVGGCVLY